MSPNQRQSQPTGAPLQARMIAAFVAISGFSVIIQAAFLARAFSAQPGLPPKLQLAAEAAVPGIMANNFFWSACFLVPLMLLVGYNATRKVARPAELINNHLRKLASTGKRGQPCHVNPSDELVSLVGALNAAMTRLENDRAATQMEAS